MKTYVTGFSNIFNNNYYYLIMVIICIIIIIVVVVINTFLNVCICWEKLQKELWQ